jgi:hypothetical protein
VPFIDGIVLHRAFVALGEPEVVFYSQGLGPFGAKKSPFSVEVADSWQRRAPHFAIYRISLETEIGLPNVFFSWIMIIVA